MFHSLLMLILLKLMQQLLVERLLLNYIPGLMQMQQQSKNNKKNFARIVKGVNTQLQKGLVVNAGHGLNLKKYCSIAAIPQIHELNIGHSIIAESVFVGLVRAVKDMKTAIQAAAG